MKKTQANQMFNKLQASVQLASVAFISSASHCLAQQAGVYDFGLGRQGEKRGNWTPGEWLAGVLLLMTVFLGLAVSLSLCYYVKKRQTRRRAFEFQQKQRKSQLSRDFVLVPGELKQNDKYSLYGSSARQEADESLVAQI